MSMINYASREINCKIVYYGPGLGGKTTNLEHVYGKVKPETRGKLISLATETERTLFFDFLPVDLGTIRGFKTRFHLYTVPGQVYYNASRKLILKNVDGIVFVGDSQAGRMEANLESMQNLYDNMAEYGYDLTKMPFVIQYNKRVREIALIVLDHERHLREVEPVFRHVVVQVLHGFLIRLHALELRVADEDDAVHAFQDQLAAGVVVHLPGHRVQMEPGLEAANRAQV